MQLTIWGVISRIFIQLLMCALLTVLFGGGLLFMLLIVEAAPAISLSLLIFAPLENVASRYGLRWAALAAMPLVGAGAPWLLYFGARNKENFLSGIDSLSLGYGVFGLLWVLASLIVLYFSQDESPDPRMLG